jgi:hypothetical protein
VIPGLRQPGHKAAWYRLEVAKRRLLYSLLHLGLPLTPKSDDPAYGLAYEFLADSDVPGATPVEHYLHMTDALETAVAYGLSLQPSGRTGRPCTPPRGAIALAPLIKYSPRGSLSPMY